MKLFKAKTGFVAVGFVLTLIISLPVYAQTERWVYRYNGPADSADCANSIVYGADGDIYAAGYSHGSGTGSDFIVISLNKDTGDTNWIYRYNGSGNGDDVANSIVYGADGNIYVAGYSDSISRDFTVISLTPAGNERWVYRYNGPADSADEAKSIVYGEDGNIYAAGGSGGVGTYSDFTILSLTSSGSERWVYRYDGPVHIVDRANSLVYGLDGNIYVTGAIGVEISPDWSSFAVISLTASGSERWVYQYHAGVDEGYSIVYGADGNIYSAGKIRGGVSHLSVISLTSSGGERWIYRLPTPHSECNGSAYSLVYGLDGNIYAAGVSDTTSEHPNTNPDFTVVSLTSSGSERWVYRYDGPIGANDHANSVIYGADNNVYAAGAISNSIFTIISLTSSGGERWIYEYDAPTSWEKAYSLVYGEDGNIYAAGYSGSFNSEDFIVISLNPEPGVEEAFFQETNKNFSLSISTFQNERLEFSLSLLEPEVVFLSLYSIAGKEILSWQVSAPSGTSCYTKNLPALSSGVYVLKAETTKMKFGETRKIIYVK